MAAQNNNGLIITLSCSMLLSVVLAVFTWLTVRNNAELLQKTADLEAKANKAESELRDHITQVENLKKAVIGSAEQPTDAVLTAVGETVKGITKDGTETEPGLEAALVKTGTERDLQKLSSDDRLQQLNQKTVDLQQTMERKDAEIASHRSAAEQANDTLRKSESKHSEQLADITSKYDNLSEERNRLQAEFNTFKSQKERELEDLRNDLDARRNTIVVLRQKLFQQEDLSFDKPDGALKFVDQEGLKCYINLGSHDKVQEGTSFSVYTKSNNGVGRRNTEDVKGKIEVVNVMGPNLSEARIVDQDLGRPLAAEDPIYSPLFAAGRQLQIAVVGNLDFDDHPGSDSDEFRRIVESSGAIITVQTSPKGDLLDGKGDSIEDSDLSKYISEQTRFLVIGDTGKDSETKDASRAADYHRIQKQFEKMNELALSHGVYVISLSSFLEFIGYSKKLTAWTPKDAFPAALPNGAKSSRLSGGLGLRSSSAAIAGSFSSRRKATSSSTGHTSKAFKQPTKINP